MKKARPNFAKEYNYLADIQIVAYKKEFPKMVELVDKYLQKFAKNDPIRLYEQSTFVLKQAPDKIALQKSELWMQQAVKLDNRNVEYLKLYMEILVRNGKVTEAQAINNQILLLQKS
jgi:predicted CoA-binding protein